MRSRHDAVRTRLSPYVTLVAREVQVGDRTEIFHSLAQADYVTVLAITKDDRIPLVRQFRPALGRAILELPGGLLEPDEAPEQCAARELREEAGVRPIRPLRLLGRLDPDSGRLENSLWAFFAAGVEPVSGWRPEAGVERVLVDRGELVAAVADGRFTHALHVAILGLAMAAGVF